MNKYVASYFAAALVMIALDMLWLGVIAKSWYASAIGHLMAGQPNVYAAVAFYAVYAAGLMVFVVAPNAALRPLSTTLLMGALFGFFAYATYDLSNLATLRDWPLRISVIDMAWGAFASALAALAAKLAWNWSAAAAT